jgi:hypothetical protein
LKKEKDELHIANQQKKDLMREHEVTLSQLHKKIDEHKELSANLVRQKDDIDKKAQELSQFSRKIELENAALASSKKDHEITVSEAHKKLAARESAVSEKEKQALEAKKIADSLKAEYEAKIAQIKKLAG